MTIELIHPITHDGMEYGRGLHDVSDELAILWFTKAPHAVRRPQAAALGIISKAPDVAASLLDRLWKKHYAGL